MGNNRVQVAPIHLLLREGSAAGTSLTSLEDGRGEG
jgi:hypothetical protein